MKVASTVGAALLVGSALAAPTKAAADKLALQRRERLNARRTKANFPLKVNATSTHDTDVLIAGPNKEVQYDSNWAGAVQIGSGITQVSGTFTVPSISGGESAGAAFWVGIDGDTCQSAILQTGVSGTIDGGEAYYAGWYEWYPNYSITFDSFGVSPGDQVYAYVESYSSTSGIATLENLSTGQQVSHTFENQGQYGDLCNTNAEWIVEDFESGGSLVNFADFGTVTFTGASYNGGGLDGSTVIDIEGSNGQVLAEANIDSNSQLTVQYTG